MLSTVFVLCTVGTTYAQSSERLTLPDSTWALQFSIEPNFTLGSFDGSMLSIQRYRTAQRAWRAGIFLSTSLIDTDTEQNILVTRTETSSSETTTEAIKSETNRLQQANGIGGQFQWIRYSNRPQRARQTMHGYVGIGPSFAFNRGRYEHEVDRVEDDLRNGVRSTVVQMLDEEENSTYRLGGGVLGTLGALWLVHPNVALLAEYNAAASMQYRWGKQTGISEDDGSRRDSNTSQRIEETSWVFSLGSREVQFGLVLLL